MTVADVFAIRGRGTVATGTVEEGSIRAGDEVTVNGRRARIDAIEAFRKKLDAANPGDNVGLLFRDLDGDHVHSGDVITGEGSTSYPDIGLT
jgi:elongation factor Tu